MKQFNIDKTLRLTVNTLRFATWVLMLYDLFKNDMPHAIFACCILILTKDDD